LRGCSGNFHKFTPMKRYSSVFLVCLSVMLANSIEAQDPIVDSLKKIALRVNTDSSSKLYAKIANIFTGVNSDSVRKYAGMAQAKAPANSATKGDALLQFGNSYHMENKLDSALTYYEKALHYFEKINNNKGIGKVYQSFAVVKNSTGDIAGAIEDSKKAAEIYQKANWPLGMINVYSNISVSYLRLKKYEESIYYSRLAFSGSKQLNDSLKYYSKMSDYGSRLMDSKHKDSAVYYIRLATPFLERNGMYSLLIPAYTNLAGAMNDKDPHQLKIAKVSLLKAKDYTILSGAQDNLRFVYGLLAGVYITEKKIDSVAYYYAQTIAVMDTMARQEAMQLAQDMEVKYETEKKELQIQNQALEIDAKEAQNKQKSLIILLGSLALLGSGFFGAIAFINYRKTKKANLIIEKQKMQVELKNEEITHQKELVEEKQKEIIDSINYAKRIQQAVLTGEDVWNKVSKEHFILFKPKDIVSVDFYWAYNTPNGRAVFALADCTGHGVPGGFMSMLGNSFLNEIVVENKIFKANEILNRLRSKIISALEQKGMTEQKDGMDISLCVWNKMDHTLEFAGANNPLWILKASGSVGSGPNELIEYKADKMPIGTYLETEVPFSSTNIALQKGDIIYLSTDGYADQFGGDKGKKMKYKPFMELLVSIAARDMPAQKAELDKAFENWRKSYDQVDDVSVIGIRV
jgi:serine phosphatase RsbU (regulator of sigma subunit)